jgi:asparagine synthase (glutamine-hydrolysing)
MTMGFIDAGRHHQTDKAPLVDAERGLALIADCRLDNRSALAARLSLRADCPDFDLLAAGYLEWGDRLPRQLVGDFAIAIWDLRRGQALLIRDRLAVKPLFYVRQRDSLTVATDLPLLVDMAKPPPEPDDDMVVQHLLMNYQSRHRTFWSHVKRVPGAHIVTIRPGGEQLSAYWQIPEGQVSETTTAEVHEAARALFVAGVRRRLESEAPLVAHLSGGVDSTSIVCASRLIYGEGVRRPPLFLGGAAYPGLECDESPYIRAVARETSFPLHFWDARLEGITPLRRPTAGGPGTGDLPTGDVALARHIGARVILSGQGGDFLCGPEGVAEDLSVGRSAAEKAWRIVGPRVPFSLRVGRTRRLVRGWVPLAFRREVGYLRARWRAPEWLAGRWRDMAASLSVAAYASEPRVGESHVKARHWTGVHSPSLALVLENEQQRAAEQGLEMRYPLLDDDFVTYVLRTPAKHWPSPVAYARLHREFMGRDLPEIVRTRSKTTFSEGVAYRLRKAWDDVRMLMFSGEWHSARYVNRQEAQVLTRRAEQSVGHDWHLWRSIWGITTLESWLRTISGYCTR